MLILSRRDVLDLLTLHDCIGAVERAFRLRAEGRTLGPGVLDVPAADGGFHVKAAGLVGERSYFAAKTNANFPENPQRLGAPDDSGDDCSCRCEHGQAWRRGEAVEHSVRDVCGIKLAPRGLQWMVDMWASSRDRTSSPPDQAIVAASPSWTGHRLDTVRRRV